MNLQSAEYEDNKGFAEDLTEGKFSFPVVHGVRADMGDRRILSECPPILPLSAMSGSPTLEVRGVKIRHTRTSGPETGLTRPDVLQKKTTSHSLKHHTVEYLRHHTKSFAYTHDVLRKLEKQVRDEVERLGGNVVLEEILKKLGVL